MSVWKSSRGFKEKNVWLTFLISIWNQVSDQSGDKVDVSIQNTIIFDVDECREWVWARWINLIHVTQEYE